jgi:error-prone DNA polymerase
VKGLRERTGNAIVAARAARPFASVQDLAHRGALGREELAQLASMGALAAFGGTRRQMLWETAEPVMGDLFAGVDATAARQDSPLRDMTEPERIAADYAGSGLTLGRHPMALLRAGLAKQGVTRATDLARLADGDDVRVAGSVIVRQRPGTAKGVVFLTLEDETGLANLIVTPLLFRRLRLPLVAEPYLLAEGVLQKQDGVIAIRVSHARGIHLITPAVPSHDFG